MVNAAQCESCKQFLLVVGVRETGNNPYFLFGVYPLVKPYDTIEIKVLTPCKCFASLFKSSTRLTRSLRKPKEMEK